MLDSPGPWFVSPVNDTTVISILPANGSAPTQPSQHPLRLQRGYPIASRFASPIGARQVCLFPDLVKLVDTILDMQEQVAAAPTKERPALTVELFGKLVLIAGRCRDYLGTEANLPTEVKVASNRWAVPVPPFSKPHLEQLEQIGLSDQVELFRHWQEKVDPFRGIIL